MLGWQWNTGSVIDIVGVAFATIIFIGGVHQPRYRIVLYRCFWLVLNHSLHPMKSSAGV